MPRVTGKLGSWEVPHAHMWKDRKVELRIPARPIIGPNTRIATIGSCFAAELAAAMQRLGLNGAQHPHGTFYTARTIAQAFEVMFAGWKLPDGEPPWNTSMGWVHPLAEYHHGYPSREEMSAAQADLDQKAETLFRRAEVIVITMGLIEGWVSKATGMHYRQLPPFDVFPSLDPVFSRATVSEILADLERTYALIREHTKAQLVITVSPVPLHTTFTDKDIRIANSESKGRLRAAVSEFVDRHPEVVYFPSYEMVVTAERQSDFMLEDGRHVSRRGVEYILSRFLRQFGADIAVPQPDESFLTPIAKTAERAHEAPLVRDRLMSRARGVARRVAALGRTSPDEDGAP